MGSVVTAVRDRVEPTRTTALVAAGDLFCIAVFVFVGETVGHGMRPTQQVARFLSTYTTFAVGWAVASLPAGLHRAAGRSSAGRAAALTAGAWVVAAGTAQLLRATPVFAGDAALTFYLVSVGVVLALLLPWRVGVTRFTGR